MKKLLLHFFIFIFFSDELHSKNDLYDKIDLFGEVLENVKKNTLMMLIKLK